MKNRALIIGLTGAAVQAIGFAWEIVHIVVAHWHEPLSARHLMFEPGILVIVVGFAVSVICVPLAIEVAMAKPADIEFPAMEMEDELAQALKQQTAGQG
jgi:hypothetical protein